MTGGQAFVFDPDANLTSRLNTALVEAVRPDAELLEEVRWLVERHHELTQSPRAAELLKDWANTVNHMWLVAPIDQIRRLQAEQAGRVSAPAQPERPARPGVRSPAASESLHESDPDPAAPTGQRVP